MKKTYMETRKAIKELILAHGIDNIYSPRLNELTDNGHNLTNIQNAISYFMYSPATAKYRVCS